MKKTWASSGLYVAASWSSVKSTDGGGGSVGVALPRKTPTRYPTSAPGVESEIPDMPPYEEMVSGPAQPPFPSGPPVPHPPGVIDQVPVTEGKVTEEAPAGTRWVADIVPPDGIAA